MSESHQETFLHPSPPRKRAALCHLLTKVSVPLTEVPNPDPPFNECWLRLPFKYACNGLFHFDKIPENNFSTKQMIFFLLYAVLGQYSQILSDSSILAETTLFFWAPWREITTASVSLPPHEGLLLLIHLFKVCDLKFLFYLLIVLIDGTSYPISSPWPGKSCEVL